MPLANCESQNSTGHLLKKKFLQSWSVHRNYGNTYWENRLLLRQIISHRIQCTNLWHQHHWGCKQWCYLKVDYLSGKEQVLANTLNRTSLRKRTFKSTCWTNFHQQHTVHRDSAKHDKWASRAVHHNPIRMTRNKTASPSQHPAGLGHPPWAGSTWSCKLPRHEHGDTAIHETRYGDDYKGATLGNSEVKSTTKGSRKRRKSQIVWYAMTMTQCKVVNHWYQA